jgi:hypothetical protein
MNEIESIAAGNQIAALRVHDRMLENKASDLALILAPRIRHADHYSLKALKLALRNYNVNTGKWRDTPQK